MTLIRAVDFDPTNARADWSRWIADCPNPYCASALMLSRFQAFFECWDCGSRSEIAWPSEQMTFAIERLLMMRPYEKDRCWNPGETLRDLVAQNGILGCYDQYKDFAELVGSGVSLLTVDNAGIITDKLPVAGRQELKALGA